MIILLSYSFCHSSNSSSLTFCFSSPLIGVDTRLKFTLEPSLGKNGFQQVREETKACMFMIRAVSLQLTWAVCVCVCPNSGTMPSRLWPGCRQASRKSGGRGYEHFLLCVSNPKAPFCILRHEHSVSVVLVFVDVHFGVLCVARFG